VYSRAFWYYIVYLRASPRFQAVFRNGSSGRGALSSAKR